MASMKAYRHVLTGKTAIYPDTPYWRNHPHFELVDSADCVDCPKVVLNNETLIIVPDEALDDYEEEEEAEDE